MRCFRLLCLAASATAFHAPLQIKTCRLHPRNYLNAAASDGEESKHTPLQPSRRHAIATGVAGFVSTTASMTYSPELATAAEKVEAESVVIMGKLAESSYE